jgi:hypothetical protein
VIAEDIRDLQRPGKTLVVRGEAALECRHRRLNAFGGGTQLPAQLGQPIGANVALDQPPADALLKFCELRRQDDYAALRECDLAASVPSAPPTSVAQARPGA